MCTTSLKTQVEPQVERGHDAHSSFLVPIKLYLWALPTFFGLLRISTVIRLRTVAGLGYRANRAGNRTPAISQSFSSAMGRRRRLCPAIGKRVELPCPAVVSSSRRLCRRQLSSRPAHMLALAIKRVKDADDRRLRAATCHERQMVVADVRRLRSGR